MTKFLNHLNVIIMRHIFLIFCIAMIALSCEKDVNERHFVNLPLFGDLSIPDSDAQVFVIANGYGFSTQKPAISIYGDIFDKSDRACQVEALSIGGVSIKNFSGKFSAHFDWLRNESDWKSLVKLFESESSSFLIKSKDLGNIQTTVKMPALLKMDLSENPAFSSYQVEKSKGLKITFNSPLYKNMDKVGASVVYHSIKSRRVDDTLPDQHIAVSKVVDASAGSIFFTPGELSALPEGGIVTIVLGNVVIGTFDVEVTDNTISIVSVSYEYSTDLTVVQ